MFYEKSIIKLVYIKKDQNQRPVERDVGAVVAPPRETAGPWYKRPINTVEKRKCSKQSGETTRITRHLSASAFDIVLFIFARMVATGPSSTSSSSSASFSRISSSNSFTFVARISILIFSGIASSSRLLLSNLFIKSESNRKSICRRGGRWRLNTQAKRGTSGWSPSWSLWRWCLTNRSMKRSLNKSW